MRFIVLALAFFAFTVPAVAQDSEMDRAERELRGSMAASGAAVERVSPEEVRVIMPSDITFAFNRADVRHEFVPHLRDLARTLARYPGMSVDIIGHADAIGSDAYNQQLSEARARSVGAALGIYGVDHGRIVMSGRGEWEPVASNSNEWDRARNRRVEIRIKSAK